MPPTARSRRPRRPPRSAAVGGPGRARRRSAPAWSPGGSRAPSPARGSRARGPRGAVAAGCDHRVAVVARVAVEDGPLDRRASAPSTSASRRARRASVARVSTCVADASSAAGGGWGSEGAIDMLHSIEHMFEQQGPRQERSKQSPQCDARVRSFAPLGRFQRTWSPMICPRTLISTEPANSSLTFPSPLNRHFEFTVPVEPPGGLD